MKTDHSVFIDVRGLRYHCRIWGETGAPKLFMLHGWMDVSASFQFLVDALQDDWQVIAPDWRGYGLSAWGPADCYWFPDYMGDLDRLLAQFQPEAPVTLIGHSMGGNIASMYAGVRPQRVARLVNLEGFGMSRSEPAKAPARYAKWLAQLGDKPGFRDYADFAESVGAHAHQQSAPVRGARAVSGAALGPAERRRTGRTAGATRRTS